LFENIYIENIVSWVAMINIYVVIDMYANVNMVCMITRKLFNSMYDAKIVFMKTNNSIS